MIVSIKLDYFRAFVRLERAGIDAIGKIPELERERLQTHLNIIHCTKVSSLIFDLLGIETNETSLLRELYFNLNINLIECAEDYLKIAKKNKTERIEVGDKIEWQNLVLGFGLRQQWVVYHDLATRQVTIPKVEARINNKQGCEICQTDSCLHVSYVRQIMQNKEFFSSVYIQIF